MRILKFTALIFFFGLFSSSCNHDIEALGIQLKLTQAKLNNGMNIIVVEDHSIPVVSYQSWYKVGSVDEKPGSTGIAHFFEHLMFKGTEKFGPKEIFQKLEARGAIVNAYTTRDFTVYHETITPTLFDLVVEIESDRMTHLKFTQEILDTERMVVLEERRLRTDNQPAGKLQEALWALAYRRHPYRFPVIGYPDDLIDLTVDKLKEFYKSYYQPSNLTVVVVGDINAKVAIEKIKSAYEKIPSNPRPKREILEEVEQNEERRLVLHDEIASSQFAMAYHVTSARDDDSFSLDVLSNILFSGNSSRAYRRLVEDKNILLSISGSNFTPTYPGLFMVVGVMRKADDLDSAEKILNQVIREIQENGVTEEEIKTAVRQLTVELVDHVQTMDGVANLIGTVSMIYDDPRRFADDLAKYQKVTAKDVQRVAVKYLQPNNRSIVTLKAKK